MNGKEEVPDELLALVDTAIVFIINGNESSGDTDRGGGGRKKKKKKDYSMPNHSPAVVA